MSKSTRELQQETNAVILPLVADPRKDIANERKKVRPTVSNPILFCHVTKKQKNLVDFIGKLPGE